MGGLGSGLCYRWDKRETVESHRSLDVNQMNRAGVLVRGYRGGWQWWDADGERTAWIQLRMEAGRLVLSYRYRKSALSVTFMSMPRALPRGRGCSISMDAAPVDRWPVPCERPRN